LPVWRKYEECSVPWVIKIKWEVITMLNIANCLHEVSLFSDTTPPPPTYSCINPFSMRVKIPWPTNLGSCNHEQPLPFPSLCGINASQHLGGHWHHHNEEVETAAISFLHSYCASWYYRSFLCSLWMLSLRPQNLSQCHILKHETQLLQTLIHRNSFCNILHINVK
jgi:hypothetical protein